MNGLTIVKSEGELNPKDKKVMVNGLLQHHAKSGHTRNPQQFNFSLKNDDQKLVGAISVTFLWNGMEISSLWVDKSARDQGLGKKLMEIAEKEATKRGCTIAYTNTFPWQAPDFYKKLGYKLYGKLDNFPEGYSLNYYSKKLV